MIITLITIGLMVGTALLVKNSKKNPLISNYVFVLLGGVITLLFEPLIFSLYTNGLEDGGAIQIASTIFGIYFIGWAIVKLIKFKKVRS